jgi:DNA-binding LytR/AlgR family response regulator
MVDYTFIKSDKKLIRLAFADIAIIRGLGNYVEILTIDQRRIVYYKTLKELIDRLPDEFLRVHNSFIVNIRNVDFFEDNHLTIDSHRISVAKSYRECLSKRLDSLLL